MGHARTRVNDGCMHQWRGFGLGDSVQGDGDEFVEQMGRIVPQYSVLKQQLCKNLDRLKELERHAFLVSGKQLGSGGS